MGDLTSRFQVQRPLLPRHLKEQENSFLHGISYVQKDSHMSYDPSFLQVPYVIIGISWFYRNHAKLSPTVAAKPCHFRLSRPHWCSVRLLRATDCPCQYLHTHQWGTWNMWYMGMAWCSWLLSRTRTYPLPHSSRLCHCNVRPTRHWPILPHPHLMQQRCSSQL